MLDNEAIELEFISVLIYYTYMRKLEKEESMMCRNDKSRVDPKWKTQQTTSACSKYDKMDTSCLTNYSSDSTALIHLGNYTNSLEGRNNIPKTRKVCMPVCLVS